MYLELLTLTCRELAGTIVFSNRAEGGARVTITFPLLPTA
jgi:hypothetical protein